jgi:hypothetical protein
MDDAAKHCAAKFLQKYRAHKARYLTQYPVKLRGERCPCRTSYQPNPRVNKRFGEVKTEDRG